MKIVSISQEFFDLCGADRELMTKRGRPCIVVVKLRFKGKKRDFAIPLRSNIAPNIPKKQYFALPPRPTTKPGHRHGIHYIKMFPVQKRFQKRFRTEGSRYYEMLQRIIDANTKKIVADCQAYLDDYERNGKPKYAVDIDRILNILGECNRPVMPESWLDGDEDSDEML